MENKILVICPYFGQKPPYFELWKLTASYNTAFDFLILGDFDFAGEVYENIKMIRMEFLDLQKRIHKLLGDVKINAPYKICDYRPAFGEIFSDFINGYDFWGYCDLDILFGNISDFINDSILNVVDKCYRHGHFTLYRNKSYVNTMYRKKIPGYANYENVFSTNYCCHFDESSFLANDEHTGLTTYFQWDFYDIPPLFANFVNIPIDSQYSNVILWDRGKLILLKKTDECIKQQEILYVHLQKRKMNIKDDDLNGGFLIIPNSFIKKENANIESIINSTFSNKSRLQKIKKIYFSIKNITLESLIWRIQRFKIDDFLK